MDEKYKSSMTQLSLSLIASGVMLSSGMNIGYPAVALPAMYNDSRFHLTSEKATWVASSSQLTMAVGSLIAGPSVEIMGRRFGLMCSTLPAAIGWLLMGLIPTLWATYLGRLLTGLAMGFSGSACTVYVSEIASPTTRSALTVIKTVAFSIGLTLVYFIGFLFKTDWGVISLLCGIFPVVSFLLIVAYIPESPVWLKRRRRMSHRPNEVQNSYASTINGRQMSPTFFERPEVYKPFIIMNIILFFRQMAGTSAILSFAVEIVKGTGFKGDHHLLSVILGLTRIGAGILAAWLSAQLGRRLPVSYSGVAMSAAMLLLAKVTEISDEEKNNSFIIFLLVSYIISTTIYGAIPQAMIGEVYPSDVRGVYASVTSFIIYVTAFIAQMTYNEVKMAYGYSSVFKFYGILSIISTILPILFLPETHGKTFKEISHIFNKKMRDLNECSMPLNPKHQNEMESEVSNRINRNNGDQCNTMPR